MRQVLTVLSSALLLAGVWVGTLQLGAPTYRSIPDRSTQTIWPGP